MYIDARRAKHFDSAQVKATLLQNKDFVALQIRTVDDPKWSSRSATRSPGTSRFSSGPAGAKISVQLLKPFRP